MKRTEMRFRTRAKFIKTREGDALSFGFKLGPISIFCIVNMPESGGNQEGPLVYLKMDLRVNEDWTEWTSDNDERSHSHSHAVESFGGTHK